MGNQRSIQPSPNTDLDSGSDDGCFWIVLAIILVLLIISPIDPIPDVIPVAGWIDDVGAVGGLLYILSRR